MVCEPESAVVSHKAQIHVNESLTPYRKRLLGRILQFKRDHNYKFIWTANGKIMLNKTESSTTKCFVTHEEFEEFLDELNQLAISLMTSKNLHYYAGKNG